MTQGMTRPDEVYFANCKLFLNEEILWQGILSWRQERNFSTTDRCTIDGVPKIVSNFKSYYRRQATGTVRLNDCDCQCFTIIVRTIIKVIHAFETAILGQHLPSQVCLN